MAVFFAAVIVAIAVGAAAAQIVAELRAGRDDARKNRTLSIAGLFAPAIGAVQDDPKALLTWQPVAKTIRQLFPEECASLDAAAGEAFPFGPQVMADAHARWSAAWLAWELTHDAEFKLKTAVAEQEPESPGRRARLDAIEREKLDLYQRRYEEYIRVGKMLQKLAG